MKLTRIVALAILAASTGFTLEQSPLQAQTLRSSGPPAEYPPAAFKGKQFVDSRGCVYIRAGIDGNVNWVPRVARNRKQLCGYKPTAIAGSTARPTQKAPEQITLRGTSTAAAPAAPVATQPAAKPAAKPRVAAAPQVVTTAKPRRTPQTTTARVPPAPVATPRRVVAPAPVAKRPAPAPQVTTSRPAAGSPATAAQGGCAGASAISQQYINKGSARCGPQAESPVTYRDGLGNGLGIGPQSSVILTPNTRVLPVHVYQDRRHSQDLSPPPGYKAAWQDDRLNLQRAERDLRPAVLTSQAQVPPGYILVDRSDNRMNPMRGVRTAQGDAQMAAIWENGTPRTLRTLPLDRQVVRAGQSRHDGFQGESKGGLALRLSSRSAPRASLETATVPAAPARYIRAATFADAAEAKQAAQALAAHGVPVRLGSLSRQGVPFKVVLAGPFGDLNGAQAALSTVRAAGYPGARISR
ncbi:SPOR domain-containing protein [Pseudophaeobacter leonis]|uniref:SPOR domain-containing protein n=1 Tax=Pseudophaeobacter leonis TaxID=1144477 RepID=UPI0009F4A12A|nr:SPOR domain-containing protein [Pseudophaeobacter leonis]